MRILQAILFAFLLFFREEAASSQTAGNEALTLVPGSWIEVPDNPTIAIPVFTVECWLKVTSSGLIVTRDASSGLPSDWQLWCEFSRRRLAFITAIGPPDSYFYTPDNSVPFDTWFHVALVVNGPNGAAELYINGNPVISPRFSARQFTATTGLAWGGYYRNPSGAYLYGSIDEARYWNRERTPTEIRAAMNARLAMNDRSGLVGYWSFCSSYADSSGKKNDAVPNGACRIQSAPDLIGDFNCSSAGPGGIARIKGIVNTYTLMNAQRNYCDRSEFDVVDATGYSKGDDILVVQMQGARIDTTDAQSYGTVLDYGSAGKWECARISDIQNNHFVLAAPTVNSYDPAGLVQIVRICKARTIIIDSVVTAPFWSGLNGGVVALWAEDSISFSADLDVAGHGFNGGAPSISAPTNTQYGYKYPAPTSMSGTKGEGIDRAVFSRAGRGPLANGGGGGNAVNTGGGGGGNGGTGGIGGKQYIGSGPDLVMGLGGKSLLASMAEKRIFLAGGGGGGHQNDGTARPGARGGGMVLLICKKLYGNNHTILAHGGDALTAGNDGGGGGGAGGTVLLAASDSILTTINVQVNGGKGSDVTNTYTPGHCHGPGGGGGGGVVWLLGNALPATVRASLDGGNPGITLNNNAPCYNTSWGAEAGGTGTVLLNLSVPQGTGGSPVTLKMSPDRDICRDSCTNISAFISGGTPPYSISWVPANGLTNPGDSVTTACPKTTTTYAATITDGNGCTVTGWVTVRVVAPPSVPSITSSGDTLTSTPATRYQWYRNGQPIPGATSQRHVAMLAGSYTVRVYNSAGCWAESPPEFHGGGPAISTIALGCADSLYYNPGDRIHMPILLTASQNLTQNGVARYTAHLRYLRNVLMAADSVVYDVRDSGPERSIALDGLRRGNIESGELGGIDFIAMLGDTLCTHVTLDSLVWEDRAVTVSFVGQECELCVRTCSEGGTRLFSSEGKFQLRQNRPNPFNGGTEIEFTMIERGPARLSVLDLFGRTLAVPFEGDREPGAYTVRFDAAGLPSGTYMYLLQSRSLSWSRLMQIVK